MKKINLANSFSNEAEHILYVGDVLDFLPTIPDKTIQLIITSPPYNLGKEYEERLEFSKYLTEQTKVIRECFRVLKDEGSICWQVGNYVKNGEIIPLDIALYPIFSDLGLHLRNRIIWHFGHGLHASKRFSGRYEVVLWFTKTNDYTFNLDEVRVPQKYPSKKHFKGPKKGELSGNPLGKNPSDVWDIPNVKANHIEKTAHPCQFPVELIERFVLALTNKGDIVLDPFMGVGSTAIAAILHERRAFGAEIMPEYVQIAKDRIHLAEEGKLKIRPMDRDVFDPNDLSKYKPPKVIEFGMPSQQRLLREKLEDRSES